MEKKTTSRHGSCLGHWNTGTILTLLWAYFGSRSSKVTKSEKVKQKNSCLGDSPNHTYLKLGKIHRCNTLKCKTIFFFFTFRISQLDYFSRYLLEILHTHMQQTLLFHWIFFLDGLLLKKFFWSFVNNFLIIFTTFRFPLIKNKISFWWTHSFAIFLRRWLSAKDAGSESYNG